jgi:hypothetical protein
MRSEFLRVWIMLASGAAGLPGQSVVVPESMAGVEGGGGTSIPFGSNLPCRYQVVYDAIELPWSGPRILTGISLRPDQNLTATAIPAKGFLDVSVLMSTTARSSTTLSATFADNYGTDATWVMLNQPVQLPSQPASTPGPMPANIHFAFSVPWAYGFTPVGTDQPAENLLVEIWIHSQPSGAYRLDNLSSCIAPTATFGNQDPQCSPPNGVRVVLDADTTMLAGSTYGWQVTQAPANSAFLLGLNLTNTGGLFGQAMWPLPYPMFDAANPSQPSPALAALGWGAAGCWLNIDPIVWLGGITDAAGSGSAIGFVPPGRDSVGDTYYAQALVLAPTANPLRLISSLGRESTVCGPLGVARNFAFYNPAATPPQPVPTAGSVQYGVGPVIEVQ